MTASSSSLVSSTCAYRKRGRPPLYPNAAVKMMKRKTQNKESQKKYRNNQKMIGQDALANKATIMKKREEVLQARDDALRALNLAQGHYNFALRQRNCAIEAKEASENRLTRLKKKAVDSGFGFLIEYLAKIVPEPRMLNLKKFFAGCVTE